MNVRMASATEPSDAPRTRQCEDCGGTVSLRAQACPHCGAPIEQQLNVESQIALPRRQTPQIQELLRNVVFEEDEEEREQQLRVPRRGTITRCVSCGTLLPSKGSQELCILCSAPALEAKAKAEKSAAARGNAIARRKAIANAKAEMSAAFEAKAEKSAAAEKSKEKLWNLAVWAVLLGVPAVHFIYWDSQGVSLEDAAMKFLAGAIGLTCVVWGFIGFIYFINIPLGSIKIRKHIDVDDDGTNDFTLGG